MSLKCSLAFLNEWPSSSQNCRQKSWIINWRNFWWTVQNSEWGLNNNNHNVWLTPYATKASVLTPAVSNGFYIFQGILNSNSKKKHETIQELSCLSWINTSPLSKGGIQWLRGQEEVVGGPKNLYFCPRSGLKMST